MWRFSCLGTFIGYAENDMMWIRILHYKIIYVGNLQTRDNIHNTFYSS